MKFYLRGLCVEWVLFVLKGSAPDLKWSGLRPQRRRQRYSGKAGDSQSGTSVSKKISHETSCHRSVPIEWQPVSAAPEHLICTLWYLRASQQDTVLPKSREKDRITKQSYRSPNPSHRLVLLNFKWASKPVPLGTVRSWTHSLKIQFCRYLSGACTLLKPMAVVFKGATERKHAQLLKT